MCAPPPLQYARRLQTRQHVAFDASRPSFERRIYSHDPGLERLELVGRYAEPAIGYGALTGCASADGTRALSARRIAAAPAGSTLAPVMVAPRWSSAGGCHHASRAERERPFLLAAGSRAGRTRVGESAFAESGAPSLPRTYPIARHAEQRRWQAAAPPRGLLAARARRVLSVRPTIAGRERPRDLERKPVPSLWMHVFT